MQREHSGEGMGARQRSNSAPAAFREDAGFDEDDGAALTVRTPVPPGLAGEDEDTLSTAPPSRAGRPGKTGSRTRNITVLCRFRPENAQEVANGGEQCVEFPANSKSVTITNAERGAGADKYQFFFHQVFQSFSTQSDIHAFVGEPVTEGLLGGYNSIPSWPTGRQDRGRPTRCWATSTARAWWQTTRA